MSIQDFDSTLIPIFYSQLTLSTHSYGIHGLPKKIGIGAICENRTTVSKPYTQLHVNC